MIISHVKLFMVFFSHVTIIADSALCFNAIFGSILRAMGQFIYIIDRIIHGCLEILNLFLVLTWISHSFALLTRQT